jgi:hypothetical protein
LKKVRRKMREKRNSAEWEMIRAMEMGYEHDDDDDDEEWIGPRIDLILE